MASKILAPPAPFARLQVKKPAHDSGSGFIISSDAAARVVHLEHSVRFLQEQHRLMLSGLHAEIEALRERNRDLQFQLIFNKESSPKATSPASNDDTNGNKEVTRLKREVCRLEREGGAARGEARAAEARALQMQRLIDVQAEKLRELESLSAASATAGPVLGCAGDEAAGEGCAESRAELRVRLAEAERLVRRLRADADRREVLAAHAPPGGPTPAPPGGAVTNLLFDGAAATQAHLQCMKNSLHASLRASGLDNGYGYQNYHFPSLHTPDFWRDPIREDYNMAGVRVRSNRRPLLLPELTGHQIQRSTVFANNHTRQRVNGYEHKNKKTQPNNCDTNINKMTDEHHDSRNNITRDFAKIKHTDLLLKNNSQATRYPELKIVVTKLIQQGHVNHCLGVTPNDGVEGGGRARARRHNHRKHASTDHT